MIRTLIWDAGGTLFDTYPAKTRAIRDALAALGGETTLDEVFALTRTSTRHTLETLAARADVDVDALTACYRARYEAVPPAAQPPFPGVRDVCVYVAAIGRNFVVTHRSTDSLESLLHAHDLARYVTASFTKESPYPRKPAPDALVALMTRYGLDAGQTVAIGDRALDVQAAKSAGLRAAFFGAPREDLPADVFFSDYPTFLRRIRVENAGERRI
jgi:phosphoglycolate phosphatase-like HAD superfamily hydrolase